MTYSIPALIAYNLSQLRRHMLSAGATDQQWRDGLMAAKYTSERLNWQEEMGQLNIDPENVEPFGPQNHPLP